jgi:RHS repeat-associated protein
MKTMTNGLKLAGALIALLLWSTAQAGTVTYVYSDPQGTPLAEADANGNITATFDYRPYGTQALGQAPSGPGYTGHVNDPEIGLVYMQARYYDPEVGRFLSVDPVGTEPADGFKFNRYDYANDNPVINVDPDGRRVGMTSDPTGDYIQDNSGRRHYCDFCLDTTGEIIDQKAQAASDAGNHAATYAWAFAGTTWKYLGAEPVSQVYDKGAAASRTDMAMAAVTILTLGKGSEVTEASLALREGMAAVRTAGREGEAAVRAAVDIGPKRSIVVAGRIRIPDGMTSTVLSEVKNVRALSYTQQLRDYAAFAASQPEGFRFDLYVRPGAALSGPLKAARDSGAVNILEIPL